METLPLNGYETLYTINDLGEVYSLRKNRKLANRLCSGGYPRACLYCVGGKRKDVRVHRLIAEHFLPNPMNYGMVNHINGNKLDNRVDNLEWCDATHNARHAFEIGLTPKKPKILSEDILKECAKAYLVGIPMKDLAKKYDVSRNAIEAHVLRNSAVAKAGKKLQKKIASAKTGKALSKKVIQKDMDGIYIREWDSMLIAGKTLGINPGNISNVCRGHSKSSGGFKWEKV